MNTASSNHYEIRPKFLAAWSTLLAWTNSFDVGQVRVGLQQGASPPVAGQVFPQTISTGGMPGPIVSDGTRFLYYADQSKGIIFKVDTLHLTTTSPVPFVTGQGVVTQMAIDANNLYWCSLTNGTVCQVSLSTGGTPFVLVNNQTNPWGLCLSPANIYYSLNVPQPSSGTLPTIFQIPKGGGAISTVATNTNGARWMASDSTNVYWTEEGGNVSQAAQSGFALTVLETGVSFPRKLFSNGTNVYYISAGTLAGGFQDGSLTKVPVGGGGSTVLASSQLRPFDVLVAGSWAYWTSVGIDNQSGSVQSVAA